MEFNRIRTRLEIPAHLVVPLKKVASKSGASITKTIFTLLKEALIARGEKIDDQQQA